MPKSDLTATAMPEHASVLHELEALARTHMLVHDLAVGRLILERFFDGDAAAFHSHNPYRETTFGRFVAACKDELAALGQSEGRLKRCVRAQIVWRTLPAAVKDQLQLSHLLELARCTDPTTRARLALAATNADWTVLELRQAVTQAKDAGWDSDDQPSVPNPETARPLAVGRLTTRGAKLADQTAAWLAQLAERDPAALSKDHRASLAQTADRLTELLAELRRVMG